MDIFVFSNWYDFFVVACKKINLEFFRITHPATDQALCYFCSFENENPTPGTGWETAALVVVLGRYCSGMGYDCRSPGLVLISDGSVVLISDGSVVLISDILHS